MVFLKRIGWLTLSLLVCLGVPILIGGYVTTAHIDVVFITGAVLFYLSASVINHVVK